MRDLVEAVLDEFSIQSDDQFISDTNKHKRKGIFIKETVKSRQCESLLTRALNARSCFIPRQDFYYLECLHESNPNYFNITIIIADTKQEIKLVASKKNTVEDVLNFIYSIYIKNKEGTAYRSAEGYELRLADGGKPIYEMSALNHASQLGDYDLDVAAFCPKKKFTQAPHKNTEQSLKKKSEELGMKQIKVHIGNDETTLIVQSEPGQLLEDVFDKIAIKRGLARKKELYKFLEYSPLKHYSESVNTLLKYNDPLNIKEIYMSTLIQNINATELILIERFFPDLPEGYLKRFKASIYNQDFDHHYLPKEQQDKWEAEMSSDCIDIFSNISCDYKVSSSYSFLGVQC